MLSLHECILVSRVGCALLHSKGGQAGGEQDGNKIFEASITQVTIRVLFLCMQMLLCSLLYRELNASDLFRDLSLPLVDPHYPVAPSWPTLPSCPTLLRFPLLAPHYPPIWPTLPRFPLFARSVSCASCSKKSRKGHP